ncbi:phosphoethanolamine transferase [Photobacterium arenosum]|uniref:phosphoethanolamine transferase n=1 Tax=Photobacterium arenosum TaxID=2774143 RepID=UPI002889D330|nr:phosphoethanolamine--lipid A transferase [Photobacterium arenosum]
MFRTVMDKLTACMQMKVTTFIMLMAAYFSLVLNQPVVNEIFTLSTNVPDVWFPYTAPLLLFFAFIIIFSCLAVPYLIKPIMIILTLTSAGALFSANTYHVLFDTDMMENIFETNTSEVSFYINASSLMFLFLYGVIPSILIACVNFNYRDSWVKEFTSRLILVLVSVTGIALIALTSYKDYASVGRNNHYLNRMIIPAHVYNTYKYINKTYLTTPLEYIELGQDATLVPAPNGKPTLLIFVLGETARGMNFHQNGYARETNPYTKDLGLVSFQDVSSCGTYTALSVPCMFSNMTRQQYNKKRANAQDNVVDVIARSGVETLWIDNDGGDKGVAKHTQLIKIDGSKQNKNCNGSTCYDTEMFAEAQRFIDKDDANKFLVLHSIGSHGPTYWQRYPDQNATFTPACNRSDIENCSDKEITNVYDNTLVYTDFILSKAIEMLKEYSEQYNVAMIYVSDHGESLGENGLYLHGTPYAIAPKEQTTVPWLMWLPKQYAQQKQIDLTCIEQKAQHQAISHDNLFHTLLGLYGINSADKNQSLDLTASCKISA